MSGQAAVAETRARQALDRSAPMRAIPPPRSRTRSTAATSPRGRPASRSPSICRPRPATTPTTSWPAARSARSASRSRISATCGRCSTRSRSQQMNTSMTINATAAWLLALYVAVAEEQGAPFARPAGHDAERHHQGIPLARHLRVPARALHAADQGRDPVHDQGGAEVEPDERLLLPPAGGRRDAGAGARLRARHRHRGARHGAGRSGEVDEASFADVFGRISFFVNAGLRFVTEICKMRAFSELWDEIAQRALRHHRPEEAHLPLRRAGELARPDRAAAREQRPPHPDRDAGRDAVEERARARAVQLPAWNEALGLPRPWDQQWSLRMQQILAYETDLLEYDDIFDGSKVIDAKVEALKAEARGRARRASTAWAARSRRSRPAPSSARWSNPTPRRISAIEAGDQVVVGVNQFQEGEPSPLTAGEGAIFTVVRDGRDGGRAAHPRLARASATTRPSTTALAELEAAARAGAQHHAGLDRGREGRRHHRRMGRDACARSSASTARPTGVTLETGHVGRGARMPSS